MDSLTYYEFFAGGGLVRCGLGPEWKCLFANDISEKKAVIYRQNYHPAKELLVKDIHEVVPDDLPGFAKLAWASFPCQDLSLAGNGAGLRANRSGTFWPFWSLIDQLDKEGRSVPIITLENVVGLLTSSRGRDLLELLSVLIDSDYRPGCLVIDALHFVPQSRPRLFVVALKKHYPIPDDLTGTTIFSRWHPNFMMSALDKLPASIRDNLVWWKIPFPNDKPRCLNDIIEEDPRDVCWHTKEETEKLLSMMSQANIAKVKYIQKSIKRTAGTIYKRTRDNKQRAEVRFDGLSGCLRTPAGGSSRQIIMIVEGQSIRTRLLSIREAARLMGLPDTYKIPSKYNDGYHIMGDAVVVPVVSWLGQHLLRPLANHIDCSELSGEILNEFQRTHNNVRAFIGNEISSKQLY